MRLLLLQNLKGKPLAGWNVGLLALKSKPQSTQDWLDSTEISSGKTGEDGSWVFLIEDKDPHLLYSLAAYSTDRAKRLGATEPVALKDMPEKIVLALEVEDHHGENTNGGGDSSVSGYARYLEEYGGYDLKAQKQTAKRLRDTVLRRTELRKAGRDVSRGVLGQRPVNGRPHGNFIPYGAVDDGAGEGPNAQDQAVSDGLERLSKTAGQRRGITVRAGFGLLEGETDKQKLDPIAVRNALSLVRSMRKSDPYAHSLKACEHRHRLADAGCGDKKQVAETRQNISVEQDAAQNRPTTADVDASLRRSIPSGPADATAYYHYRNVQVAWGDVWTGVFDAEFEAEIADLYAKLTEQLSYEGADEDLLQALGEAHELDDMIETFEDISDALDSALVVPSEVAGWLPEVAQNWASLSAAERDEILFLSRVDTLVQAAYQNRYTATPPQVPSEED